MGIIAEMYIDAITDEAEIVPLRKLTEDGYIRRAATGRTSITIRGVSPNIAIGDESRDKPEWLEGVRSLEEGRTAWPERELLVSDADD